MRKVREDVNSGFVRYDSSRLTLKPASTLSMKALRCIDGVVHLEAESNQVRAARRV